MQLLLLVGELDYKIMPIALDSQFRALQYKKERAIQW